MKKLKYIIILILLIPMGIGGYIVNSYYEYETKQENVREFQKLAFKGYSAVNQGKYKEALSTYEKAVAIYDKDDKSLADLAMLYRKKDDIKKAREYYKKAYEASNENYKHLYNTAICDYLLKDYQTSINILNELIHKDKNSSKYYKFLALNYYALQDKVKAFGYYGVVEQRKAYKDDKVLATIKKEYDALTKKPKPLPIVYKYWQTKDIKELEKLLVEYKNGSFDIKALRTAQKILSINSEHNLANQIAAELLFNHGVLGEVYRYSVNVKIHDAKSLEILGAAYQNAGEYEKALETYEKSYAKNPKKELLRAMVVCSMKVKKIEDMNTYIARLNEIDPYLTTKLVYAIETNSGIKHDFWDKVEYLGKLEIYKAYCKLKGCNDA